MSDSDGRVVITSTMMAVVVDSWRKDKAKEQRQHVWLAAKAVEDDSN